MDGQPDRIEQFKADIADLRIADPSASRDHLAQRLGLVGLALGVVLPIVAYAMSHGTTNALTQRDAIVVALLGVSCAVAGGALYLRAPSPASCASGWSATSTSAAPRPTVFSTTSFQGIDP